MNRRTPLGTWATAGLSSLAVAGTLTALAPSAAAEESAATLPVADVLDVDLVGGVATDHARNLEPTLVGSPTISADAVRARHTIGFDGVDDAAVYSMAAQYPELAGGFAVECSFRYDGTAIGGSEQSVCGSKEAGGMATVVSGGNVTFMAHIGGGYKNVRTPIVGGAWYHTMAVWDGALLTLYVNGEQVSQIPAAGAFKEPSAGAHNFVLGGDAQPGNGTGFYSATTVQSAKVYSEALTAEQVSTAAAAWSELPTAPAADVLDVDFRDGTPTDHASGLPVTRFSNPQVRADAPLSRDVAELDGSSAFGYPIEGVYPSLQDGFAVECVFKYDDDLPASGEERGNLCAGKESGGFSITLYGDKLSFNPHIGGSYRNLQTPVEADQWYHVVGSWDGNVARLYLNGVQVKETPATGQLSLPKEGARNFLIGGDASTNNRGQFFAPSTIAAARLYSEPLAELDVLALQADILGEGLASPTLTLQGSTPAEGSHLTRAVPFEVTTQLNEAIGRRTTYRLDDEAKIKPGQVIGAGMRAGDHEITMVGKDVFGRPIDQQISFTSANIPTSGGTQTEQGDGKVTLSSVATNPSGGDVVTTFTKAAVKVADQGFQGSIDQIPASLDFDYQQGEQLTGALRPGDDVLQTSPSAERISFQRYDIPVAEVSGQRVVWTGQVDPTRLAGLRVWNGTAWEQIASARGQAEGSITLNGDIAPRHRHGGVVPVLVTGEDPFADDIPNQVRDSFEDPSDYDFSLAHLTDTQYLSEGADERPNQAERDVWRKAYTDTTQWIADNTDSRKIAFTAHTGDIMENWHNVGSDRAKAMREFEVASAAQKILDDAGLVNTVLPGNHDNLYGVDTGPDALYNDYFGPERYEALSQHQRWTASNASYHSYAEGDNSNNYVLFSAGGLDFVVVSLGFGVDSAEAAWADDVLTQYADRNAIVLTHAYTTPSSNPDGRGGGTSYDGFKVREDVVAKNPNVFLVLSGHEHGVNIEVKKDLGEKGNHVVELLADYQFYKVDSDELGLTQTGGYSGNTPLQFGAAFFRLLQFDVDRAEMSVDTYSPFLDNFGATEYDDRKRYNGTEDDFKMPIQLQTRATSFSSDALVVLEPTDEVIGTETTRSGWPATITWDGLEVGETYAWQASSRDAASGDELVGEVNQLALFTALEAGVADREAPVITFEETTTLELGAAFDPRAGVSVSDNRDGDLSGALVVHGEVDTTAPGRYQVLYTATDAAGNQSVAARTVEVSKAPAPVSTSAPRISGRAAVGQILTSTNGSWNNADEADFSVQWLRNGSPIKGATGGDYRVTGADVGTRLSVRITATLADGTATSATSSTTSIQKAKPSAKVSVKKSFKANKAVTLKARFAAGEIRVRGIASVKVDGRTVARAAVKANGTISVKLPKLAPGKHQIVVTLPATNQHAAATVKATVVVRR